MGDGMSGYEDRSHKETIKPEDVGSLEEVLGEDDSLFQNDGAKVVGETKQTLTAEPVDLTGSQEVAKENENPEDFGKEEAKAEEVKPAKVYPVEVPIEYLKNTETGNIFPVNKDIVRQKFLVPCTKEGKVLPDHRRPSDFR